jgi:cell division protein FtsW (lipid II flippase)
LDPLQLLLILTGLAAAGGGLLMLYSFSRSDHSESARRPYAPLAIAGIGLMIAYRAFSDFRTLDSLDHLIMFLFVFALLSILGVQFFVVDRHRGDE